MKLIKLLTCLVALCLAFGFIGLAGTWGWQYQTPAGLQVQTEDAAVTQYEHHWRLSWTGINWNRLDALFDAQCTVQDADLPASKLKILIKEWEWHQYPEETSPAPRILSPAGFVQAYTLGWKVFLNLGIDPGQGDRAFCATPVSHELNHLILRHMHNKCWPLGEIGSPSCRQYDLPSPLCE